MGGKPDSVNPRAKTVTVLGGGLAGLSAACRLLELSYGVTLVEKRPFLGGRVFSFYDREVQCEVDNGQHVFMGCCTSFIDFLKALGAYDCAFLQQRPRVEVVLNGRRGVLASVPALGPLHLLPSLLLYPHLGLKDKLLALYGLVRARLMDRSRRSQELDGETAYQWLRRHHQTERAINNLWNFILLPTLNDDVREVNADMALMVFQEGLMKRPRDANLGYFRVGLSSLAAGPARRAIEARGGKLLLGQAVKSLVVEDGRVARVVLSSGAALEADACVSALPYDVLLSVLPPELAADGFFARAAELSSSPIVNVHIWYDRPVMEEEFLAFLESPVQWVFNKSRIQGASGHQGQYLCISVSGAWDLAERSKAELRELFVSEMARLFPRAREARVEKLLIVKQLKATFRCLPGVAGRRLPQVTPIPNLFLAGEWTDTGWPSTMEGAVRSGLLAADALAARA